MTGSVDNSMTERDACAAVLKDDFESLLRASRRQVHHAVLRAQGRVAVDRALLTLACIAGAYLALRLGCRAAGRAVPFGWTGYGCLLVLGLVVPATATMIAALRHLPSLTEAAERLDLGTQDHNRIATALSLVERDGHTAFGIAAIQDGMIFLHRLKDAAPHLDDARPGWRGAACRGGAFIVLTLLAGLIGATSGVIPVAQGPGLAAARPSVDRRPVGDLENRSRDPGKPQAPQSQPSISGDKRRREAMALAGRPPAGLRNEPAAGRASGDARAEANPSDRSASARGDSTDASASSQVPKRKDAKTATPKKSKESRVVGARKPEKGDESSSIGQGSSGGGAMSAVQNPWSQRDQATEGEREQNESEQAAEDESESNTQRGGIQPSLKDRKEAPTKDLGISSAEEGPPGTGRGGPTPPKKSRGTASLVLGVPVPDFVKGRVGPGTTKVTHERVEPTPMPGDPTTGGDASRRSLNEAVCPRFDVPSAFASLVRDYLVALHSADQKAPAGAGTEPRP